MENLNLKITFLIGKIGRYKLANKLNVSYAKLMKIKENNDSITIKQLEIINSLYQKETNE